MSKLEEYINQDIHNPKYLYHGSSRPIEKLEPRQSHDSYNKDNEDFALFLTNSIEVAAAYAFRSKIKELTENCEFSINHNVNNSDKIIMTFNSDIDEEELTGFVHVFKKPIDAISTNEHSTQYKCYHDLVPIKIFEVRYKDFEKYFKKTMNNKKTR